MAEWFEDGWVSELIRWFHQNEHAVWWMVLASTAMFIGSLVAVRMLIVRLPAEYFLHRKRHPIVARRHPVLRVLLKVLANAVGIVFVLAGILMLVLPGQGLLTIAAGLMLMNFPGKFRLERWIVSRGPILRSINRIRRRNGRGPLVLDD